MEPLLPIALAAALLTTAGAAYVNTEYGFSVTPPGGWKQVSVPGTLVAFTGPLTGGFGPNFNLLVSKLPAGLTLKQLEEAGRAQLSQVITDYKFVGRRDVKMGGLPAVELTITGRQGKFNLYFIQTYALKNNLAFVSTGTTQQATSGGFAAINASFVKTFAFTR